MPLILFGIKADEINTAYAYYGIDRSVTAMSCFQKEMQQGQNLKRPISPQFTAPIMDKVRAVASSAVFFMAVYLLIHSQYDRRQLKYT